MERAVFMGVIERNFPGVCAFGTVYSEEFSRRGWELRVSKPSPSAPQLNVVVIHLDCWEADQSRHVKVFLSTSFGFDSQEFDWDELDSFKEKMRVRFQEAKQALLDTIDGKFSKCRG